MDKIKRKSLRIVKKGLHSLNEEYNGDHSNGCDSFYMEEESKIVFIANAGLTVGVDEVALFDIFTSFGFGDIRQILSIPGKQYSFALFFSTEVAKNAVETMSGIARLPLKNNSIHLALVNKVPLIEQECSGQLPPGLLLIAEFISEKEEKVLANLVNFDTGQQSSSELIKQREVRHFGYEFNYETNSVDRSKRCRDIPPEVLPVIQRIVDNGYMTNTPDQLTVTRYLPGQGIPLHVDTHSSFTAELLSLSLVSGIAMDFVLEDRDRKKNCKRSVYLKPRSLCVMTGPSRYLWAHGIRSRKTDIVPSDEASSFKLQLLTRSPRISFTFRKVLNGECSCPYPLKCDSQFYGRITGKFNKELGLDSHSSISELEEKHVQSVYEEIADHFSDTRHKPWPKVIEFIDPLPLSSRLLEIGCGNGKYLGKHTHLLELGLDTSLNLLNICRSRQIEVSCANCLWLPFRSSSFEAVICIAVIHHLASEDRRLKAIQEIYRVLCTGGEALIYVWAMEQRKGKMSAYLRQKKSNRSKMLESSESLSKNISEYKYSLSQSILQVYDERKIQFDNQCNEIQRNPLNKSEDTFNFFDQFTNAKKLPEQKLQELKYCNADLSSGPSLNNETQLPLDSLSIHENRTDFAEQDLLVPWKVKPTKRKENKSSESSSTLTSDHPVYYRFYHVFREGELENLVRKIHGVKIVKSYYDEGNWCVCLKKVS